MDIHNLFGDMNATPFLSAWMQFASNFWENAAQMQAGKGETSEKTQKGMFYKTQKTFESSAKIFQTMFSKFCEPENLNSFFKGTDTVPDFVMDITQNLWDGFFELQKQWTDRMNKFGQHTKAYSFDDIDHESFTKLREIYEKEIQKYFHVPQIGLTRFYQERFNRVGDKFNLYQTALNELLYMFYIPIEKSLLIMQEKIEKMAEDGNIHDNFKEYYNMWIKILEGHYMTLLQSPEYTHVLSNTIDSLVQYRTAKEEVLYDMIQFLPIPTNKEMDDFYKEFYYLKKKVRELSKEVESLKKGGSK